MSKPITIEDIYELFRASQAEAERRSAEIDRLFAASREEDERRKAVDSLTTRWGRFVEELVEPAVIKLFQTKGIDVKEVYPRARSKRDAFSKDCL